MADGPTLTGARKAERDRRNERLARALRENLRRRKEQARARDPGPDAAEADAGGAIRPVEPPA